MVLTHLPLDKIAVISQTTFSDAFSWMKILAFWLKTSFSGIHINELEIVDDRATSDIDMYSPKHWRLWHKMSGLAFVVAKSHIIKSAKQPPKFSGGFHYNGVIMSSMASRITSLTTVYSRVYSGADQRKHQSSASLAFVRGIHRWPVNSPHKGPVTRIMFPFDDVIM